MKKKPTNLEVQHRFVTARFGYRCEICGTRHMLELHHIVEREWTKSNEEARRLSECPELLVLLCRDHHTGAENAHNEQVRNDLLRRRMNRVGREKMQATIDRLNEAAGRILIQLPED